MKQGFGLPVFPGVAIGPAVVYRKAQRVLPVSSGDPAIEQAKFNSALETAREQLTALYEKAKVEIGEDDERLVIELEAIFEQEVMLTINVSGGAIWKWKWIFPYIYDYQMNANIDVGTYTGIGITATARTQDSEGFDWGMSTGSEAGDRIISIGRQIKDLMETKEEFMGELTVPSVGMDGEGAATLSNAGLAERYAAMMENAEESWIEILRVDIFSVEGHVDPFHILCYGIGADFMVSANMYVTLGMTFEFISSPSKK